MTDDDLLHEQAPSCLARERREAALRDSLSAPTAEPSDQRPTDPEEAAGE